MKKSIFQAGFANISRLAKNYRAIPVFPAENSLFNQALEYVADVQGGWTIDSGLFVPKLHGPKDL